MPNAPMPSRPSVRDPLLDWLAWMDRFPVRTAAALFLVALGASVVVGLVNGIPVPSAHDEFAYLLASETFASGRVTNPTHPFWHFFETFHVIHEPSYVSKYPPGQGLALALGEWMTGLPIAGAWLTAGFLAAATYWMARAWIPGRWALLAALASTVQLAGPSYWAQSYWGGNVAAIGGALLVGAAPRVASRPGWGQGALLGAGLVILANSRPFEGFLTALVVGGYLLVRLVRAGKPGLASFGRRTLPAVVLVLALGGAWMGYYNARTVGSALTLPYQVHEETYSMSSLKPWKTVESQPEYRHRVLAQFHHMEVEWRKRARSPATIVKQAPLKAGAMGIFFLGFFGLPAMAGLPGAVRRNPCLGFLAGLSGLVLVASFWTLAFAHYLAPVAPVLYLLLAASIAHLVDVGQRSAWARHLLKAVAALFLLVLLFRVAFTFTEDETPTFGKQRDAVLASLEESPDPDLVFVQYRRGHAVHNEWVYNDADIDGSAVVWARDMGAEANRRLLEYYPDRTPWLMLVGSEDQVVDADEAEPVRLMAYPPEAMAAR